MSHLDTWLFRNVCKYRWKRKKILKCGQINNFEKNQPILRSISVALQNNSVLWNSYVRKCTIRARNCDCSQFGDHCY